MAITTGNLAPVHPIQTVSISKVELLCMNGDDKDERLTSGPLRDSFNADRIVMRSCQYGYIGEANWNLLSSTVDAQCRSTTRVFMRSRTRYRVEMGVMRGPRFSSCSIFGISSTLTSIKSARSGEHASVRIEGPRRYMIPEQLITYNRSLADLIDSQTRPCWTEKAVIHGWVLVRESTVRPSCEDVSLRAPISLPMWVKDRHNRRIRVCSMVCLDYSDSRVNRIQRAVNTIN
ncbi:hypothetical protein BDN71DRAFT_1260897 [Pleurotus eryngii]|uniref:Uncharacterized protein n=1 Tax=Pleurotus eryngii TaxID=5323 RepID=A0A9P6AA92_PLEER|nr:hypothetical protein BDN71DRAFT_1260897 [Pleurotus eryngii]